MKPFAETADENKTQVLPVIKPYLKDVSSALEIASGTGQQVVYFAEQTPQIIWQPTDLAENLSGISAWIDDAGLDNVLPAKELDAASVDWPVSEIEFAYTSNSLHIMSWQHVIALFEHLGALMKADAYFCVYGPFSFDGKHISQSNVRFDQYLKQRDPRSGVRDLADLKNLGKDNGIELLEIVEMPHNNHILVWQKH